MAERLAIGMQFGYLRGTLICSCGSNMHTLHKPEERAICLNKACEHYNMTFTVLYPQIMLVAYEDTVPITSL
jgi:hypothetical protein